MTQLRIHSFLLALKLKIVFAALIVNAGSYCDGDPDCVSQCESCPDDQSILAPCCFGVYQGQQCIVWSPSAGAELCDIGSSSASNPPVSCKTCLECPDANICSSVTCSKDDLGTCCCARSNENGPPDLFEWFCKNCANCKPGYYSTAYDTTKQNCRACEPGESRGINCF